MAGYIASGRPFMEWISSQAGKNFLMAASGIGGAFVGFLYWIPNAPGIDKAKDILQMYHEGLPVRPSPHTVELISEALGDCGLAPVDATRIRWFTCFGFEPINFGQVSFRKGSIIGLPKSYSYQSVEEIDRAQIKLSRNKSLPWRTEAGAALKEALVLSDEAKKFVIAREVHEVCTSYVVFKTASIAAPVPFFTTVAAWVNEFAKVQKRPKMIRVAVNTVWGAVALSTTVSLFEFFNRYYERYEDEEVAKMGEDYAKGGVEFYAKTLLRNRALRELLGPSGARSYSTDGDVSYLIRKPHLSFTKRREICQNELDRQIKERENPVEKSDKAPEAVTARTARTGVPTADYLDTRSVSTDTPPELRAQGKEVQFTPNGVGGLRKVIVEKP